MGATNSSILQKIFLVNSPFYNSNFKSYSQILQISYGPSHKPLQSCFFDQCLKVIAPSATFLKRSCFQITFQHALVEAGYQWNNPQIIRTIAVHTHPEFDSIIIVQKSAFTIIKNIQQASFDDTLKASKGVASLKALSTLPVSQQIEILAKPPWDKYSK